MTYAKYNRPCHCKRCGTDFTAYCSDRKPYEVCEPCRKDYNRTRQREFMRAHYARQDRTEKLPYTVIHHSDPSGFRPGAKFSGEELTYMVKQGWVDGMRVRATGKHGGGVYEVRKSKLVEVTP